jgi:hypothetical protein
VPDSGGEFCHVAASSTRNGRRNPAEPLFSQLKNLAVFGAARREAVSGRLWLQRRQAPWPPSGAWADSPQDFAALLESLQSYPRLPGWNEARRQCTRSQNIFWFSLVGGEGSEWYERRIHHVSAVQPGR